MTGIFCILCTIIMTPFFVLGFLIKLICIGFNAGMAFIDDYATNLNNKHAVKQFNKLKQDD